MAKVEKVLEPSGPLRNRVSCHDVEGAVAPLILVAASGEETVIGKILWCPYNWWVNGKKYECNIIHKLRFKNRDWPKDLDPQLVPRLIGKRGPGYWMSQGFHIGMRLGSYFGLDEFGYLPPFDSEDELTPQARNIVNYRKGLQLGQLPPQVEQDRKTKSTGDDEVSFV